MSKTYRRIGVLTAMLCFAFGATALASITVSPSSSITLRDYEGVTITATSHGTKSLHIAKNTCSEKGLGGGSSVKQGSSSSSETGHPSEQTHTATIRFRGGSKEGECAVTFSDGTETETVHVRIVKEP